MPDLDTLIENYQFIPNVFRRENYLGPAAEEAHCSVTDVLTQGAG